MKAILFTQYGSPDVLQLRDVEKPMPKGGEVLVKIQAAAANPLDWHRMRGAPFLVRISDGIRKPNNPRLGVDIAGVVVSVGSGVSHLKPGDEVFGNVFSGGFAEYAIGRSDRLTLKPANISFDEAAAVPIAAITALQGLRDKGKIKVGQKVLVNGASGGVGTYAVQIAKSYGAEVTAVCSGRNADLVRSIGADHVIDYTREDFTKNGKRYDLIYDAIANRSVFAYKRALKPGGVCAVAGFTTFLRLFEHVVIGALLGKMSGVEIGPMAIAHTNQADLLIIKDLLASGRIKSVIDRHYPLAETAEAIRYLETNRARGKIIVNVAHAAV